MRSAIVPAAMLVLLFGGAAQGGDFRVIHDFCQETNCADGSWPFGNLTVDDRGNIWGWTAYGGAANQGVVYKLERGRNGKFTSKTIYSFCKQAGCPDGQQSSDVIRDTSGNLYGTTYYGGASNDGVVYKLTPQSDGEWTETLLHEFSGTDGAHPTSTLAYAGRTSGLAYDGVSPLYGTTVLGGSESNGGTAFEIAPDGASWRFETIFKFSHGGSLGFGPFETPVVDAAGDVMGAAHGSGEGSVYKLVHGDAGWSGQQLHTFCSSCGDHGGFAFAHGVTLDATGALVGTLEGGAYCTLGHHHTAKRCGGGVFQLKQNDSGGWDYAGLYYFCAKSNKCRDGHIDSYRPAPVVDASGNIYGTTVGGGIYHRGVLYRVRADGVFEDLHDFCDFKHCREGREPQGLGVGPDGRIYGITLRDGAHGVGAVFEYKP